MFASAGVHAPQPARPRGSFLRSIASPVGDRVAASARARPQLTRNNRHGYTNSWDATVASPNRRSETPADTCRVLSWFCARVKLHPRTGRGCEMQQRPALPMSRAGRQGQPVFIAVAKATTTPEHFTLGTGAERLLNLADRACRVEK